MSGAQVSASTLMVYPNYFATLGISMAGGRDFNTGDLGPNSPLVAVVNESFARQAFNGENAVGQQYMTQAYMTRGIQPCEIIGVVRDARYSNLRGETQAVVYRPFLQTTTGRGQMVLHARVAGNSGQITPRIREEIQKIDNTLPMFEVYTLAQAMDAALIRERLIATLSSLFGALALLLASVGLYGLMAFTVVQRTGEMGIRMALGARRGDVQWMIMRESLSLLLIGIAIGLPMAFVLARFASSQISGLLFGLTATDPLAIIGATAVMVIVAAIAGYLPALRASQLDPMVALRTE